MKLLINENRFNILLEERGAIPMVDDFIEKYSNYVLNNIFTPSLIDRVVGGSNYNIIKMISSDSKSNTFQIKLKDTLNNFLDNGSWFKNIVIVLSVVDYKDINDYNNAMHSNFNSGSLSLDGADMDNNVIIDGLIELNMCSYKGEMKTQDLKAMLSHEFGHLYSFYNKALKGSVDVDKSVVDLDKLKSANFNSGFLGNLSYVLYILQTEEIRAEVASVYHDLKAINSESVNFKTDIIKTNAYIKYGQAKKVVNKFKSIEDKEILNSIYVKFGDILDINSGVDVFRKTIIKYMDDGLKKLLNGIGRIASKYYDDIKQNQL